MDQQRVMDDRMRRYALDQLRLVVAEIQELDDPTSPVKSQLSRATRREELLKRAANWGQIAEALRP